MKGFITFVMLLVGFTAGAVEIITDPVDVNITREEADSLFADYRSKIVDELTHVGLFSDEDLASIASQTLTITNDDAFSSLNVALEALKADYEAIWATLSGSFVSLMAGSEYWLYLDGGEGSKLSDKATAWKLTHQSMTTFMFSANDVELEMTIEPADKKYPKGIILNLSGSKCLAVADAVVTTSAPNPSSLNCIWFINAAEDPASLTSIVNEGSGHTVVYDLLGRKVSSTYHGLKIASGKLTF